MAYPACPAPQAPEDGLMDMSLLVTRRAPRAMSPESIRNGKCSRWSETLLTPPQILGK